MLRFAGETGIITKQDRRRPRWGRFAPDALPLDGGECPMLTTSVLNSILGLDIILVLVLVVLVPKRIVRLVMRETRA